MTDSTDTTSSSETDSSAGATSGTIEGYAFLCRSPGDCDASSTVSIRPVGGALAGALVTTDTTGRFSYVVDPGDWQVAGRFTLGMVCDRDAVTITVAAGETVDVGTFSCAPP